VKLVVIGLVVPVVILAVLGWPTLSLPTPDADPIGTPRNPPLAAKDSSGHGHHGVNQGSPGMGLPGHRGTAYSFDRRGSWIEIPSQASLNPGRDDFLVTAWVKFTMDPRPGQTYDIVRKGLAVTANGSQFKAEIMSLGRVRCSAKDVDRNKVLAIDHFIDVTDGRWHRIGCARTGSVWSVTVDERIRWKRENLGEITNSVPLSIGSKYGLEDAPQGLIDEVQLTIARGSADKERRGRVGRQIAALAAAPPTGLWRLDEPASTDRTR
jgi:hypothetical protein